MSRIASSSFRRLATCSLIGAAGALQAKADFSFVNFANPSGLALVGSAATAGNVLRVIPGQQGVKGAAWFTEPQNLSDGFETWFRFRLSGGIGTGDGFTFVFQNDSTSAIGLFGIGLGYSSGPEFQLCQDQNGIRQSVAVEFDTYYNSWISDLPAPHVSVQTRGAAPNCADHGSSLGATTAIPDILVGEHTARIRYAAGLLKVDIDDVQVLQVSLDLGTYPALPHGWVGFTSGSGSVGRDTDILAWTFTGSPSPCPLPNSYCTAKANSRGCTPQIGFIGAPSLSASESLSVTAAQICNFRSGLMVWSRAPASTPFQGGTLCLASPLQRTPLQDSGGNVGNEDCSGTFSFEMSPDYLATANIGIGAEIFAQYWSRDPYSSPYPVSLTNGLRFTICP
jgi:hypothetical protein